MKLFAAIALIAGMALVGCGEKSTEDKLKDAMGSATEKVEAAAEKAADAIPEAK